MSHDPGRRRFLSGSAGAFGAAWLGLNWPAALAAAERAVAARAAGTFVNLDPLDAADIEAITARIVPSDDTPGAREAGVVHFIDQALSGFMAQARDGVTGAVAAINAGSPVRFAELDQAAQDSALTAHQDQGYFGLLRFLTIAGLLAMPTHGGNRDHVGWKMIGFEHRHAWTPPFGHYDG